MFVLYYGPYGFNPLSSFFNSYQYSSMMNYRQSSFYDGSSGFDPFGSLSSMRAPNFFGIPSFTGGMQNYFSSYNSSFGSYNNDFDSSFGRFGNFASSMFSSISSGLGGLWNRGYNYFCPPRPVYPLQPPVHFPTPTPGPIDFTPHPVDVPPHVSPPGSPWVSVWGDPHVKFNGKQYDVNGPANHWYNMLSDTGLQVNGRFGRKNLMTNLNITVGSDTLRQGLDGKLYLNGNPWGTDSRLANGTVSLDGRNLRLNTSEYDLRFKRNKGGFDMYVDKGAGYDSNLASGAIGELIQADAARQVDPKLKPHGKNVDATKYPGVG